MRLLKRLAKLVNEATKQGGGVVGTPFWKKQKEVGGIVFI